MDQNLNVKEAHKLIKSGDAVLIDVREPDEFKAEHIANALSIPLSAVKDGFGMLDIPSDKIILFQCLKGSRGQMACERVQGLGECKNKILNIEGGIEAWKNEGLPVMRQDSVTSGISIMRQVQITVGFLLMLSVLTGFAGMTGGFVLAGILGGALFFAGLTGWCGLALLLAKMPWNK